MTAVDLGPPAERMANLIRGVPGERLDGPTPCSGTSLGDLLDHVATLTWAFTAAARKDTGGLASQPAPTPDASRLAADWRTQIPEDLDALVAAWRDPAAWTGMTRAGGIDMPGEFAGVVALDELVIHGWDVARASGQPYECEPDLLEVVHGFVARSQETPDAGLFGPPVEVPGDASLLDRVIGLSGRDPAWTPG